MLPTAYEARPHFWAYAFWSSVKPLFPVVDAYSSSYLWYLLAFGGGSYVFFVLLEWKLDAFRLVQNRQKSIKIHSKLSNFDKNSLQTAQKSTFVATRVMWAAHESCFLFILAAEIFLESRLDKRGILWYNISIMGSLCSFAAAPQGCCCCLDPINCC